MCGRYSLSQQKNQIRNRFTSISDFEYSPRFNVTPGQKMPVILDESPTAISFLQWGLIPNFSLNAKSGMNLFNLKSENIFSRSGFKDNIRSQRCLVVADGFYDWKKEGKTPVPYRFTLSNDEI